MSIIRLDEIGKDFAPLAVEKIDNEVSGFNGNKYGNAVYKYVADTIKDFCSKNENFAYVVYKTKRTLADCVAEIMKGCGSHIADIEVYKKAVQFYFPNSTIDCVMTITLTGEEPDERYLNKVSAQKDETENKSVSTPKREKKQVDKKQTKQAIESIQLSLF